MRKGIIVVIILAILAVGVTVGVVFASKNKKTTKNSPPVATAPKIQTRALARTRRLPPVIPPQEWYQAAPAAPAAPVHVPEPQSHRQPQYQQQIYTYPEFLVLPPIEQTADEILQSLPHFQDSSVNAPVLSEPALPGPPEAPEPPEPTGSPEPSETPSANRQRRDQFIRSLAERVNQGQATAETTKKKNKLKLPALPVWLNPKWPKSTQQTPAPPVPSPIIETMPRTVTRDPVTSWTLVTYNVRVDRDRPPHNWASRAPFILANLRQLRPSVVCLQESSSQVKTALCNGLPHFRPFGKARGKDGEACHILVDLGQWQVIQDETFLLTEGGPSLCTMTCQGATQFGQLRDQHPRIVTHVCLLAKKTPQAYRVHVLNTHLSIEPQLQAAELEQLAQFARQLQPDPVVLAGDFNTHQPPTHLAPLLERAGLRDTLNFQDEPTFGPKFNQLQGDTHRLDWITASPSLHLQTAGVSHYRYRRNLRPSDHEALYCTFGF